MGGAASRAVACAWLALACALGASSASAQPLAEPAAYRPLVDEALTEFDAGRYAEARTLFERAHAVYPNARTLRGIGMAAFELRDYVASAAALEASLASDVRPLTEEQRTAAIALRERALVFVGSFGIGPAPAGTEVRVDGVVTAPAGSIESSARVALAVGSHEIALRAPDGRSVRAAVVVHGGEDEDLGLVIEAHPSATAPGLEIGLPIAPTLPPERAGRDDVPWIVLGVGAVGAAAGAVLLARGTVDASAVSGAPSATEWADVEVASDRALPALAAGGVLAGVGLAAVIGGLVWGLLVTPTSPSRASVTASPGSLEVHF